MQPGARASSHPSLNLLALRLQYRRSEERDLLALFQSAQDLCVVEIADPDPHPSWGEFAILFYEHDHPSPTATASTGCSTSASAATTALPSQSTPPTCG